MQFATLLLSFAAITAAEPVTIVTLGDSITKAVRPGVKPDETFSAYLQADLKKDGVNANVINVGIGGENTDQALARLDKAVLARKPQVVTIMYGANDHWIDEGKKEPRVPPAKFAANLRKIVAEVRKIGGKPVLMTTPPPIGSAYPKGQDNKPERLREYVQITRDVAKSENVPLVDHYAHWEKLGAITKRWVTDPWHPNPRGQREMETIMLPVVQHLLADKK